jgi:hypothetical protein
MPSQLFVHRYSKPVPLLDAPWPVLVGMSSGTSFY